MTYVPKQRVVATRIMTPAGWVAGDFNLPENVAFIDFLNRDQEFAPLTNVTLENFNQGVPFFMMNRRSMILVVPREEEQRLQREVHAELIFLEIYCLLSLGVLHGSVEALRNIRMSDFFINRQGFFLMRDCQLTIRDRSQEVVQIPFERIIVNVNHLLGVSEIPPEA